MRGNTFPLIAAAVGLCLSLVGSLHQETPITLPYKSGIRRMVRASWSTLRSTPTHVWCCEASGKEGGDQAEDLLRTEAQTLLRLRGGKVKFKNLKEVKERRAIESALAESRNPEERQRHRGGTKRTPTQSLGKKMSVGFELTPPLVKEGSEDSEDDLGMDEWTQKGKNIFYGAERDLSDDDAQEGQYKMEEKEALRILEVKAKRPIERREAEVLVVLQAEGLVGQDQAFPEDSSNENADWMVRESEKGKWGDKKALQKVSFADTVTGGEPDLLTTTQGIELLLEEVEAASGVLRSYIEPLMFAASCRKEFVCPGRALLQLKYHSLVGYIVEIQAFVCVQIEGKWSPKHPVNAQVESAWARLEVTKSLEQIHKGDVQDLIFILTECGSSRDVVEAAPAAAQGGVLQSLALSMTTTKQIKKHPDQEHILEILKRSLQEERMIEEMVEDEDVALSKGHEHWNKLFLRAQHLKHKSEGGYIELDDGQKRAISRMKFYRNMYFLAYRKVYPRLLGTHRKPGGGSTVILAGSRRPASYEVLTNTGNVINSLKKHRSRRNSNPRLRLRHKFNDYIKRRQGAMPAMRHSGESYGGEKSGVNPKAQRGRKFRMV